MRSHWPALLLAVACLADVPARAQWTAYGQAALVTTDTLPVFRSEAGEDVLHVLVKDEILVPQGSGRKLSGPAGRAKVEVLVRDGKRTRAVRGWVALGPELLRFAYPCRCAQGCWPYAEEERSLAWNRCVQEAAAAAAMAASTAAP